MVHGAVSLAAKCAGFGLAAVLVFGALVPLLLLLRLLLTHHFTPKGGLGELPEPLTHSCERANESDEIKALLSLWHARQYLARTGMDDGDRQAWRLISERADVVIAAQCFPYDVPPKPDEEVN